MEIIDNISQLLRLSECEKRRLMDSKICDITEYGRVVHAEMEAILMCARNKISTRNAKLYCTTFPCHNCAKHIIAAGIKEVIYIEPYPKSRAFELHGDAISSDPPATHNKKVIFRPFVGVGPRRFFDLFSMTANFGLNKKRKDKLGKVVNWKPETSNMRIQLMPHSYLDKESLATKLFKEKLS